MKSSIYTLLEIKHLSTYKLGNCYYGSTYSVKAFNQRLSSEAINQLRNMGFLGYGQEFRERSVVEEKIDDFNKYYVYTFETRVDSSD